jgi:serine/threonine protein phosphatase PrpC
LFAATAFLLCSDGLFETAADPGLAEILAADQGDAAERLLPEAFARHADNNVTAVTVEVLRETSALWRRVIIQRKNSQGADLRRRNLDLCAGASK